MVKLHSSSEAYYTQTHGARYSAPLLSKGNNPTLLEFHSSMHSYLSLANLSDGVGRLYGGVVLTGADSLRAEHKQQIDCLFAALCEHTCRTHELVAIYLGFLMFRAKHPEEVDAARKSLSHPYTALLRSAEASFGDIQDSRFNPDLISAIMACAIAALNPPFRDDVARFDYLPECTEFIIRHSPDSRFDSFLKQIKPAWEHDSVMANLGMLDPNEVQPAMFASLTTLFQEIEFVTYDERPTRFSEWASALLKDGQKYSYQFMASLEVGPHSPDTAISRLSGRVEIPGLTPEDPCDLSLRSTGYAKGSPPELSAVAHACGEQSAIAFCHVFATTEGNQAQVFCFALDSADHQAAIPINFTVPLDEFIKLLTQLAPRHLVVKIDERCGADAAVLLVSTGQAIFRLLHDTSPANMISLVRRAADEQSISIAIHQLSGGPGYAVCAYLNQDRYALLAPATELGADLLYKELHELEAVTILTSNGSTPSGCRLMRARWRRRC